MTIRTAAAGDDSESFRLMFADLMLRYRGTIPATVVRLKENDSGEVFAVDVRPAIMQREVQEDSAVRVVQMEVLTDLPLGCLYSKALGYSVTIPLSEGDDCIITCADRSIDNWQWFGGAREVPEPFAPRNYDLNDAIVMAGAVTRVSGIASYSRDSIQVRDRDNTTRVSVKTGEITAKVSETEINVTPSQIVNTVSGVNVSTLTQQNVTFHVPVINEVSVNTLGATTSQGISSPTANIDGKEISNHTHPAGTPPDNTGVNN